MKQLKKIRSLGLQRSASVILHRITQFSAHKKLLRRALMRHPEHAWDDVNVAHSFDIFFESLRLRYLYNTESFFSDFKSKKSLFVYADNCVQKRFEILGSNLQQYNQIPWHTDVRAQQQGVVDCVFDADQFYAKVTIKTTPAATWGADIKVPWEFGRCQQLPVFGYAFAHTGDEQYKNAFVDQVTDFFDNNRYLHGVQWCNPMEVALRAINWICTFHYFKDANCADSFWQRFVCSLYDHMIFIESNLEWYDSRTNNHYLSNLLGLFFLYSFFDDVTKQQWCYDEFLREIKKQIQPDGTSYEGSTAYHTLVTEMVHHFIQLCEAMQFSVPDWLAQTYKKMGLFIAWCTQDNGQLIMIGDDDSGSVLWSGLPDSEYAVRGKKTMIQFPNFGLEIIKTKKWHVTLRQYAYNPLQPSGHFHNDIGSITAAVNGIPLFVDPGSCVYTASVVWRNYFRSVHAHNTICLDNAEPVTLNTELFSWQGDVYDGGFTRTITVVDDTLVIADTITKQCATASWSFMLAPDITVDQQGSEIVFMHKAWPFARMHAPFMFEQKKSWVAPAYGKKIQTIQLHAIVDASIYAYPIQIYLYADV